MNHIYYYRFGAENRRIKKVLKTKMMIARNQDDNHDDDDDDVYYLSWLEKEYK